MNAQHTCSVIENCLAYLINTGELLNEFNKQIKFDFKQIKLDFKQIKLDFKQIKLDFKCIK